MTTTNIIDICVLAFIVLSTIIGAVKGLVRSIIGFFSFALAIALGYFVSPIVTPSVVDWLYLRLEDKLMDFAESKMAGAANIIATSNIEETLKKAIENFSHAASWIVISLVALIILNIIGRAIAKGVSKTPGIKGINSLIGAILGLITSVGICYCLVFAISRVGADELIGEDLTSSIAYNFLLSYVPMALEKITSINVQGIGEINLKDLFH